MLAGDTQLQTAVRPPASRAFWAVSDCVDDVSRRFLKNGLFLDAAKTEAALFSTRIQREKLLTSGGINIAGSPPPFRESVKLLGVTIDAALRRDRRVTKDVRSSTYNTRALQHIRAMLTFCARQDDCSWHRDSLPRLRQCRATWHVSHQPGETGIEPNCHLLYEPNCSRTIVLCLRQHTQWALCTNVARNNFWSILCSSTYCLRCFCLPL